MKLADLLPAFVVALAAAFSQSGTVHLVSEGIQDDQILEAVYRFQLQQYTQERRWNVFYLAAGLEGGSASNKSVDAFNKHIPPVKKFIKSEYDAERLKKERGLVLGIAGITKSTASEAEVEGYIFVVPGEATVFHFSLVRENGEWLVKSSKVTGIA